MTRPQIFSAIKDIGIVPVVRTSSAEGAIKAIEAGSPKTILVR
jgi:hypothetical protein